MLLIVLRFVVYKFVTSHYSAAMGDASDQSSLSTTLEMGRVSSEEADGDEGWGAVATDENNFVKSLEEAIGEADEPGDSDTDVDAEERTTAAAISVFERLSRYESLRGFADGQHLREDPFWAEYFFQLVEMLDEIYTPCAKGDIQARVRLLSGCSGMLAEGWACKAGLM